MVGLWGCAMAIETHSHRFQYRLVGVVVATATVVVAIVFEHYTTPQSLVRGVVGLNWYGFGAVLDMHLNDDSNVTPKMN